MDPKTQVTLLLLDAKNGSSHALDRLVPLVYDELRRLAAHYLRDERAAATLQPTALVHEAYMRLVAQEMPDWESPLALLRRCRASDAADTGGPCPAAPQPETRRRRGTGAAGGGDRLRASKSDDILAMDDALTALAAVDERKCRVIELRYFGGLSVDETARALELSVGTIGREQRLAEAWLHREMSRPS